MDGHSLSYDGSGNPLNYYNGKSYTMTWSEGRNLASLTTGGKTATYTYDMNGLRTKKTNLDGTWVKYFVGDGKILGETLYGTDNVWVYDMRYTFDENGEVCGISLWNRGDTAWTKYYFVKNLQGDVLAVYQYGSSFTKVAEYTYDSWGNVLTATGALANINPFRYRSYYRDADTGFYYLQSRYYDPAIGRFINADSLASTGQDFLGYNMFAYCMNNPVNMSDPTGNWPKWLETTVKVVSAVVAVTAVVATVAAVSALTAGTGSAAAVYGATIFLGAALSGINGGIANEAKGNSYTNGYLGGATGGAIQATCSKTYVGTIAGGGVGVTVGTAVTDVMNNLDPDSANSTAKEIALNAITSGAKALATSSLTAYMGYSSDLAASNGANGLIPTYTVGFGESVKAFFGWLDDALVYISEW